MQGFRSEEGLDGSMQGAVPRGFAIGPGASGGTLNRRWRVAHYLGQFARQSL